MSVRHPQSLRYLVLAAFLFGAALFALTGQPASAAITTAPTLNSPPDSDVLETLSTSLTWTNPSGTTQYHIQVVPYNNDGPGIDLIRSVESLFFIAAPALGSGNYVVLPDMSYMWRVRATDKQTFAPVDDPSWGPWAQRSFRTPVRDSGLIALVFPLDNNSVSATIQTVRWQNGDGDVFYYEVQMSPDAKFGADGPISSVWHNLVHGGVAEPHNSWRTPSLEANTYYYWRVRPRVQGDGAPVAWSKASSFRTQ